MKANWVLLVALGAVLFFLGAQVGSMTVANEQWPDMPFGVVEYFGQRNQALLAAAAALLAALASISVIQKQIKTSQDQHAALIYESKLSEADAMEGIASYCDQLALERAGAFQNGRDLTTPDLTLVHRVSMFAPYWMTTAFFRLRDDVDAYNLTDRAPVKMYGGKETGETAHGAMCMALFGVVPLIGQRARARIAEIHALAPSTQNSPRTR